MKKLIWAILLSLFFSKYACGESLEKKDGFILPSSLIEIDESAFESTAAIVIKLSENVVLVRSKAFSNINTLKFISIPNSVSFIEKDAIDRKVILIGLKDSYGYKWAKENNRCITVYPSLMVNKQNYTVVFSSSELIQNPKIFSFYTLENNYSPSKGLTIGDLKRIRTTRNTDFRIDGRAPPRVLLCINHNKT